MGKNAGNERRRLNRRGEGGSELRFIILPIDDISVLCMLLVNETHEMYLETQIFIDNTDILVFESTLTLRVITLEILNSISGRAHTFKQLLALFLQLFSKPHVDGKNIPQVPFQHLRTTQSA